MSLIERTILKALSRYQSEGEPTVVTDIHLQPHQTSGELTIYDDEDQTLAEAVVEEWMTDETDDFYEASSRLLASILDKLHKDGAFDNVAIIKPYSFVMIDEEKETVTDLLLMDNDTLLLNEELLQGLDEELDAFLKDLLEK